MAAYYILILGVGAFGMALYWTGDTKTKRAIFLLTAFFVLWAMSAFRYDVGYDYSYGYAPQYERDVLGNPSYTIGKTRYEPGFVLLQMFTSRISMNYQVLFIATSVVVCVLMMLYYWRYSPLPVISVLFFLMASEYYASLNLVRQSIAAAITCFAVVFLQKKQFHWYLLVVFLAASFHKSTLLLIPFFFVNLIPIVNKKILGAYLVITAGIYFYITDIIQFVTQFWYEGYATTNEHMLVSFPWGYTLFWGAVFALLFCFRKKLLAVDKGNYVYINYAYWVFFFALMGTKHSILDRLSYNFELPLAVGIAILIRILKDEVPKSKSAEAAEIRSKKPFFSYAGVVALVIAGGLVFHQYALSQDGHGVVPYQIVFNQPFYKAYTDSLNQLEPNQNLQVQEDNSASEEFADMVIEPESNLEVVEESVPSEPTMLQVVPIA